MSLRAFNLTWCCKLFAGSKSLESVIYRHEQTLPGTTLWGLHCSGLRACLISVSSSLMKQMFSWTEARLLTWDSKNIILKTSWLSICLGLLTCGAVLKKVTVCLMEFCIHFTAHLEWILWWIWLGTLPVRWSRREYKHRSWAVCCCGQGQQQKCILAT